MPLVRLEVKNEYGSGLPELYKGADREDPKAVLDGVAVAGLVGILRQLGDLAEFAAEVFHGLQEQVMTTASRSHKLMVRLQDIEIALPPLEKAVLAQTSHLHFCYTAGSEWHPRIRKENNHFIYNDLPRFIMDSYEECRDPPRLHMLDKFDTGGPGSCLKRYSDPTFFKRVSTTAIDANAERRKEKKARKSKRRRQRQKNGEFTRSASILSGSGRMQSTTPDDYYQPSSIQSRSFSYTDATFKSDLRDQSFDSRAGSGFIDCGSGFIDCVFNVSSPTQLAKQDMKESSSSDLNLRNNDNHDPSHIEAIRFKYEDDQSLLEEKGVPDSSYVTWDEKTEIVEHESQNCDGDVASHMLQTDYCQNTQEFIDNTRNEDEANISLDNEKADPIIAGSQFHEIESETDNYMDALNTIDSESENDFDYQTKREVEHNSTNLNNSGTEGKIHDILPHVYDHHPSHFESHTAPVISLNKEMSIPNIVLSDRFPHDDSPHISGVTSETDSFPVNVFSESIRDGPKSDAPTSNFSSLDSMVPHLHEPTSAKVLSNTPAEFSGTHSVNFWTNGGLLGLEPSKPPDFAVSNAACHNLVSGSINNTTSSGLNAINDCLASRQLDETVGMGRKFSCSTPCHENLNDDTNIGGTSFGKVSKTLSSDHGKDGDSHQSIMTSTDNNPLNDRVFGLGHRLLVNGFGRKPSVLHDRTNETTKFLKSGAFENNRRQHTSVNDVGDGSSPPLELMKISFQPMKGGVESSKLKLKFQDGSQIHEPTRDMFPSFQLVPEPTLSQHDDVSDSDDDDTFCRSSPRSDDGMSYHSQSNSEQWESSETPRSRDQEIYGTLSRISSVEFISSSRELGGNLDGSILIDNTIESPHAENVVESSHLVPLFDLLSFDAVKPSPAIISVPEESLVLGCPKEPAPPPPPLPPMQWRVLKSHSNVSEHREDSVPDVPTHIFDMKELQSTICVDRPNHDSIKHQPVIASEIDQVQLDIPFKQTKPGPLKNQQATAFYMKELQSAIRVDRPKPDSIKHQPVITFDTEQVQLDIPFNQPKPEPLKNQQAMSFDLKQLQSAIPSEASVSTPKIKEQQKLNGLKVADQAANGNRFDEKEDFLQQIRTKSFNLRRTSTEKTTVSPPVPANVKVTAILEKAIAIRQAVGSDDSEVDTWSDA